MKQTDIVLKLNLDEDIRRVRLFEYSFVSLQKQIKEIYSLEDVFTIKYKDDEGDLVSITSEEELKEAFYSIKNNILYLKISVVKKEEKKGEERCGKFPRWRENCKRWKNNQNNEKIDNNNNNENISFNQHQVNPFGFLNQLQEMAKNFLGNQSESGGSLDSLIENFLGSDFCKLEHNFICDGCDIQIAGTRYHCTECKDFDFCSDCFETKIKTHADHKFDKITAFQALKEALEKGELIDSFFVFGSGANDSVLKVEHNAFCDRCDQQIIGLRWKCLDCDNFDFCNSCYVSANGKENINQHLSSHSFAKIEDPKNNQPFLLEKQKHLEKLKQQREEKEREEKERQEKERVEKEKQEKERQEKEKKEQQNVDCLFFRDILFPMRNPQPLQSNHFVYPFEQKLEDLKSMGFDDRQKNIQALVQNKGDLQSTIEMLLNQN